MKYKNILSFILIFSFLNNSVNSGKVEELPSNSKYLNNEYVSYFQISPSKMTFFANGGERSKHELSKAFDNNYDTQWFSEGQQGMEYTNPITGITYESLVNHIIITFNTTVNFDKMLYKTDNCQGCEGIGYPTELKIYTKLKSDSNKELNPYDDSDFTLIDDIISEATQNIVLFTFDKTLICDQIKIEWAGIKTYSNREKFTTAKEIQFFFPENEYLNETILNLFSEKDYTQMTLKDEYNNIDIIEKIIEKSKNEIQMNENLNTLLQRAKLSISGALKFDEKREFSTNQKAKKNIIQQRGNVASHARNTIKMVWAGTNRQSLGIFALANEKITFYVTAEDNDPLPSIRFTQYIGHYSNWLGTEFTLKKGKQTYICNNFDVSSYSIKVISGGPLYISNPYTSNEQSQNIKIYIEGGTIFPTYKLNEDEDEYKAFLSQYILMYENHKDIYLDITELYGFRTMITVTATSAYNIYKNENKGPLSSLNTWDSYIKELFIFDGVEYETTQSYYDIKNTYINLHIRLAQPFGAAYAYTEHIGIQSDWVNTAVYAQGFGWGYAHEIGHMMDIGERTVSENSNNMISKYEESFRERKGQRGEFEKSLKYLTLDEIDVYERGCTSDECKGFFTNLQLNFLVWWYLESFSPGYWGKLDNMYRYQYSISEGMSRTERLIFFSNIILGMDLGYYFYRWGFFLNNEGIFVPENASSIYQEKMEQYMKEGKIDNTKKYKFWYLDYKEYLYILEGGKGCYDSKDKYDIQIEKIYYVNNTKTILILPKIQCQGHLGFEIYEHNKLIGFTYETLFVDRNNYQNDYLQEYKIIAYDRKLIPSKESNVKSREEVQVCSFKSVMYKSIKEAVEYAESLDTEEDLNIYLLKDTYESKISINKKIYIYLNENVKNVIIYKIDDEPLFDVKEGGSLLIEGKNENNKIILDGLNITHKGSLIYSSKGNFKGKYLTLRNNYNSEVNGGAFYGVSCKFELENSLIKNNYAQNGGGFFSQKSGGDMITNLTNVIFDSNTANNGAGIMNNGEVILNNCEIKNCHSNNNGGGINNYAGGKLTIKQSKIIKNNADNMGGGLFIDGWTSLTSVEISENNAKIGGGITFSGENNNRILFVESGTTITNNNAELYGGGIYMQRGIFNLNGGEIYNNKINNINGLSATNNSDSLFLENGNIFIDKAKFDGSIFKSDSANIKLKSPILKYKDNSKIYIDFVNNGYNKTLLSGENYCITSEDLTKLNLIDSKVGNLELNILDQTGNSLLFIPKILSVSFISHKNLSFISFIEEDEEEKDIFYYGKEITLLKDYFPIKENEYIIKIYDQKGKEYKIGQKIKIAEDIQFLYEISYKNKIVLDFVDYKENKLLTPEEVLYLPSYRNDYSTEKYILNWRDLTTNEIFEKSRKIQGNKNRTLLANYISYDYFSVKIIYFNIDFLSEFLKYDEKINFPDVNVPKYNHFKGWIDKLTNQTYDLNLKSMNAKKDYLFSAIIVSYVKYYSDNKLIEEKEYNVNSTLNLLEKSKFTNKKISYWLDKGNNIKYYYDKEYIIKKDMELYAVFEKNNKKKVILIIVIIIAVLLFLVIALIIYRYIRRKNIDDKIGEVPDNSPITPLT